MCMIFIYLFVYSFMAETYYSGSWMILTQISVLYFLRFFKLENTFAIWLLVAVRIVWNHIPTSSFWCNQTVYCHLMCMIFIYLFVYSFMAETYYSRSWTILTQICVLCFLKFFKLESTFATLMISPNRPKWRSQVFVLLQANIHFRSSNQFR